MLACIQRRQNFSSQSLACTPKSLDVQAPPLLLPAQPPQPCTHKGEQPAMVSQYPSPAQLDAFAQKTANSPLSIKIFPSDVRVPQHKQLNKTVNGLDTTGLHYSPYSFPHYGGYQGLLAIVKASVVSKGVVKTSEGRRTKHANSHTSVVPYDAPNYLLRHGHKAFHISSCKLPDVPIETLCSTTATASADRSRASRSELAEVQSLMRQMSRAPPSQTPQLGGEARANPSLQAVAAVAHSDSNFVLGIPPQSSLTYAGAVLPTQSADTANGGYLERGDYTVWEHKAQMPYQQGAGRMYGTGSLPRGHRGAEVGQSPETCVSLLCSTHFSYRRHYGNVDQVSSLCVSHSAAPGERSVGRYFAPLWDNPNSDCYSTQVLAPGTCTDRLRDQLHPNHHQPHLQHPAPFPTNQAYGVDQNAPCGQAAFGLCHATALSSSLQSLECLISEIHPPCIKERMLGRGYEAMGMPQQLEHQHIHLPAYR